MMINIVQLWTIFMSNEPIDRFEIAEAAQLSGLTKSMVDYLCREKVLVPSTRGRRGRGRPRRYSFGDVVMLRALAQLLKAGVSVRRIKIALRSVRHHHKEIKQDIIPIHYLVTDGRSVFWREKDKLLDLDGSAQMSFLFVL
ncbi:MAG: MerR family transcriptional regulator, partial [Pseudomonadota bacterium]